MSYKSSSLNMEVVEHSVNKNHKRVKPSTRDV